MIRLSLKKHLFARETIITFLALTTWSTTSSNNSVRGFTSSFILTDRRSSNIASCSLLMSSSSSSSSSSLYTTTATGKGTWSQDMNRRQKAMERCIVPLSASSYKGSSGRVGVLGGSARYTGAPYYAAMASLKVGADLAFCFCAEEAAIPLKSYSPELMVIPVYKASIFDEAVQNEEWLISIEDDDANNDYNKETEQLVKKMVEEVCSMMDKMHVLVIGPGLGRCPLVLEATAQIIRTAQSEFHLPLVIDADALFLLTLPKYRNNLLSNDSSVILTPNAMELKRIRESAGNNTDDNNNLPERCLIIEKGAVDIIRSANLALNTCSDDDTNNNAIHDDITCDEVGGLKRSGGIGDVLAGTIGTLVAWNNILTNRGKATYDDLPLSCWTACCFVKRATKVAFDRHRRSMTAPDILVELGSVIDYMTTAEDDNI